MLDMFKGQPGGLCGFHRVNAERSGSCDQEGNGAGRRCVWSCRLFSRSGAFPSECQRMLLKDFKQPSRHHWLLGVDTRAARQGGR